MPPTDPNNPNSQYDFILNGDKQTATPQVQASGETSKFYLPKKAIIGIFGGAFILIIGIVVFSSLTKTTGPTDQVVAAMGTAQEIVRVNDIVAGKTKDPGTLSIAATSTAALSSEQAEFTSYLSSAGAKYDPKALALYTNTKTDDEIATAEKNNSLDTAYYVYLKAALTKYQTQLQALAKTKSKSLNAIVVESYKSTQNLLASPLLTQTAPQ